MIFDAKDIPQASSSAYFCAYAFYILQESPFPNFDRVQAEHVGPGIKALLAQLGQEIDDLEHSVSATWQGLIDPLERISDRLSRAWGTISHLKAVKDNEALRKAYEEACCLA